MSFGASTDKFGIADTNWKLLSYSEEPQKSNATAEDSNGNTDCETVYDTSAGYTNEYQYCGAGDTGGNVVFPTLRYGVDTTNGVLVTGATVTTSNTERPKLSVKGELLAGTGRTNSTDTLAWPTVSAAKKATAMGITPDTNSKVTSATWTLSLQVANVMDSQGRRVLNDAYRPRIEASAELIKCSGTPGAAAAAGYTLDGPLSKAQSNTGYGTATVNVFKNL